MGRGDTPKEASLKRVPPGCSPIFLPLGKGWVLVGEGMGWPWGAGRGEIRTELLARWAGQGQGTEFNYLLPILCGLVIYFTSTCIIHLLPRWLSGKEPTCQCRRYKRHRFHPWLGKIPWRRAWQPTPVFMPGESHGQRSLASYCPWGCKSWTHLSN